MKSLLCNLSSKTFSKKLLHWFDQSGRKNLPWQHNKSPYRVWVSEIMLQQTQVNTVIPYFLRFMERFPTVNHLADATEDEVLHFWTGLGYYTRARNLHRSAKLIKALNYFPDNLAELEQLPGIGQSTAGAILALAFNKKATILDGNVKRVLTRLAGIQEWPGEKNTLLQLWQLAKTLTPSQRTADYTQAIMDLGATLCTRGKPLCAHCPFEKTCRAHELGMETQLPIAQPKKKLPLKQASFLIFKYKNSVILEKRSQPGVWKGLWSFPEIDKTISKKKLKDYVKKHFSFNIQKACDLESIRHTFSHFHLDIFPILLLVDKKSPLFESHQIWYDLKKPHQIGLPAPVKTILSELQPRTANKTIKRQIKYPKNDTTNTTKKI